MKLIEELIKKRIELYNYNELNHNYPQSVWHFYQVYCICCVIVGHIDVDFKKKNNLMKDLINSLKDKIKFSVYYKLKNYMKKDIEIINKAVSIIEKEQEGQEFFGDYAIDGMFAISIYD